ncbi:MAG: TOBE domain-containing protein [Steroidobacteraceae bacterium]|jgi:molybdate transport system regulatory protein
MYFSARNQLTGRLTRINHGVSNDEIVLTLAGGDHILALITSDRSLIMGIKAGDEAIAVINASAIILGNERGKRYKLSARNQLPGEIKQINIGPAFAEVLLGLKGGDSLVAIVPKEAINELELAVGHKVMAIFKASNVILGIASS